MPVDSRQKHYPLGGRSWIRFLLLCSLMIMTFLTGFIIAMHLIGSVRVGNWFLYAGDNRSNPQSPRYVYLADSASAQSLPLRHFNTNIARWSRDGSYILYYDNFDLDGDIRAMDIYTGDIWKITQTRQRYETFIDTSTDGAYVFFDAERDIYSVEANGNNVRNLTGSPEVDERSETLSPDGSMIAFVADYDGQSDLYTMHLDGSNLRRLTTDNATETLLVWSMDGTRIAYEFRNEQGQESIGIVYRHGNNRIIASTAGRIRWQQWSPDGEELVYIEWRETRIAYLVEHEGDNPHRLTPACDDVYSVSWSPQGDRLLVEGRCLNATDTTFVVVSSDGQVVFTPTEPQGTRFAPIWSPSGEAILFYAYRDTGLALYIVDMHSGNLRPLSPHALEPTHFWGWQPERNVDSGNEIYPRNNIRVQAEGNPHP